MFDRYCVIMAGGIGSRFWPLSRTGHPKQFLDILGTGKSLLLQTYERFKIICPEENIIIVTSESYTDLVLEQIPGIKPRQIIAEPQRRNTAPCVAYACNKIYALNRDANIVVTPSDHLITDEPSFIKSIGSALEFTKKKNALVTLGIRPDRPDTGYGYIQFKEDGSTEMLHIRPVKTFTEKPNEEMAKFFIRSGDFLWNSGIFIWNAKAILNAFDEYLPEVAALFKDTANIYNTPEETEFIKKAYSQCKNISIDYGIMEKAKNVFVLASDFGWSDLGTWASLYEHLPHDSNENSVTGNHVMLDDTKKCIINIPKDKLAVIKGLEDFIVVEADNILLICPKSQEQEIRQLVSDVKVKKGEKYT
jgi:mannose-1-phosphate guanylyltransferase